MRAFGLGCGILTWGIIILVGLAYFDRAGRGPAPPDPVAPPSQQDACVKLTISVQEAYYRGGYLFIVGTVNNTGNSEAQDLVVEARVLDTTDQVTLAQDQAWPAGCVLQGLPPGRAAAFEMAVRVPGAPPMIHWRLSTPGHPVQVHYPTTR